MHVTTCIFSYTSQFMPVTQNIPTPTYSTNHTYTAYKVSDFLYVYLFRWLHATLFDFLIFESRHTMFNINHNLWGPSFLVYNFGVTPHWGERFLKKEESTGQRDITNTMAGRHANHLLTQHPSEKKFVHFSITITNLHKIITPFHYGMPCL
jgi:hypothetical protein